MSKKTEVLRVTKAESNLINAIRQYGTGEFVAYIDTIVESSTSKNFNPDILKSIRSSLEPYKLLTLYSMVAEGVISQEDVDTLSNAIRTNKNILITGSNGSGKTTLLKTLIADIEKPETQLLLVENSYELGLSKTFQNRSIVSVTSQNGTYGNAFSMLSRKDTQKIVFSEIKSEDEICMLVSTLALGTPVLATMFLNVDNFNYLNEKALKVLQEADFIIVNCSKTREKGFKVEISQTTKLLN